MPDPAYLPEDEAALYVMGGLSAAERLEFEARLAQSAELRALVRDLEEGAVAMALALPAKQPPRQIWQQIEKAVAQKTRPPRVIPAFWTAWWRNGWAAAAACLAGWLLYASWMHRPAANPSPPSAASGTHSQSGTTLVDSSPGKTPVVTPANSGAADAVQPFLQARTREIRELRSEMADLQSRLAQLSQSVTQQQALLGESNRFKFLQLTPAANGNGAATPTTVSPALQRAIFLAMARELGWVPPSAGDDANPASRSGATNESNIDFVDLRPGGNNATNSRPPQSEVTTPIANVSDPSTTNAPTGAIPAFISGTNLFIAVDTSIAPNGSQLTFSATNLNLGQQSLGTAVLGDNTLIVTLPVGDSSANGVFLTVAGTGAGLTNISQFYIPDTNHP